VEAWREGLGERLAAAGVDPGAAVAFPCPTPHPVPPHRAVSPLIAVTCDLALQAAGYEPVPVAVTAEQGEGGEETWFRAAASRGAAVAVCRGSGANGSAREERAGALAAGRDEPDELASWTIRRIAGSAAEPANARPTEPRPHPSPPLADLFAAAELLVREPARREVAVTTAILDRPCERLLVAWSLLTGSALVLEPDPAARVATAVWARPTLFAGSPAEAAVLARDAEGWRREWQEGWTARLARRLRPQTPTRPFGRLHTLVIDPTIPPASPSDPIFWHDRDVAYHHLPDLLP
jgi:hypothetical protein